MNNTKEIRKEEENLGFRSWFLLLIIKKEVENLNSLFNKTSILIYLKVNMISQNRARIMILIIWLQCPYFTVITENFQIILTSLHGLIKQI